MTKQEEIKKEIAKLTHINERIWAKIYGTPDPHDCRWGELSEYHKDLYIAGAELLMMRLDELGVVLKVDRELPKLPLDNLYQIEDAISQTLNEAGYTAVESLIEE